MKRRRARRIRGPVGIGACTAPDGTLCLELLLPDGSAFLFGPEESLTLGLAIIARSKALFPSPAELDAAVLAAQARLGLRPEAPSVQ